MRLTRLFREDAGRLEVCAGGIWGTVCGNGVTNTLASAVCRQLNHTRQGQCHFLHAKRVLWVVHDSGAVFTESGVGFVLDGLVPIRRTNVMCVGNERSFSECTFDGAGGDQTCTHMNDVIILCESRSLIKSAISTGLVCHTQLGSAMRRIFVW